MDQTTNGPIVRLAELEIDPALIDSYKALLAEEMEASIASEPGVLMLCAMAVKGQPHHIRVFEIYADQQVYDSHLLSPHFLKYKAATSTMVRSLRLVETDPVLLRARTDGGTGIWS